MNKYKIIILIQCRLSSSRLPAKALLPIGEYPSVVFCALRAASTGFPVIVATSTDKSDDILEQVLRRNNLQCFRGSLDDVLLRMTEAVAAYHDDDLVVRLTADNVFPDGNFINLVVSQFDESKFDYLGTSSPQDGLPYGLSTEVFKVSALREANRKANTPFDREHVTPYIKRHFRCKQFLLEHVPPSWQHLRCTMDTFDDYLRLLNLFKQIDSPLNTPWMELVKYLELSTKLGTVEKKRQEKRYENLVFGTAQLGLPYGVANQQGLPSEEQALALMQKAIKAGVMCFDTARAYGLSEQRIGKALKANSKEDIHVISKLHPLNYLSDEASDEQVRFAVKASIYETCYHLKLSKIDTLLLHRWEHRYQWREAVWDELISLKQDGVIKQIGVSVSTPVEVVEALQEPQIEHIQCPVNLLDWRWRQSEFLAAISKRKDVVFFARSVYLQGLLTLGKTNWPNFPNVDASELNELLDKLVTRFERLNRKDLCLAYVRGLPWVNSLVLGMETEDQLQENLDLFNTMPLTLKQVEETNQILPQLPESFLNPAKWKL